MTRARDVANIDGVLTTTGDTYYASAAATPARLGIGSTGQVMTVAGGVPTWSSPAGATLTIAQIASGTVTSGTSLSLTSLTAYDTLKFRISAMTTTASAALTFTINSSSSSVYDYMIWAGATNNTATYDGDYMQKWVRSDTAANFQLGFFDRFNSSTVNWWDITLTNCKATGFTFYEMQGYYAPDAGSTWKSFPISRGIFKSAAAVSSIQLNTSSAFTAGNYVLWGG